MICIPTSLDQMPTGPKGEKRPADVTGSLGGKEVYCPPPGLKDGQIMTALDRFLASNPDLAEKS